MSEEQPNNPLHGLTLEAILTRLVDHYGWAELSDRIKIRCFAVDPSIKSSLTFLRRTPLGARADRAPLPQDAVQETVSAELAAKPRLAAS